MKLNDARQRILALDPSSTIIFVGAGISLDLGFPGWGQLILDLATAIEPDCAVCAQLMRQRHAQGQLMEAAEPAYFAEVRPETRARFFERVFGATPRLKRRHRLLGQLPVAAFVTLNFDGVLEAGIGDPALGARRRSSRVFTGPGRFERFNSSFGLYLEDYKNVSSRQALVLKVHNDLADVDNIVLSTSHFKHLSAENGYRAFYETCFRSHSVLFIGFGGNDPNLLEVLSREIANYAGFSARVSYMLLPEGTSPPPVLASHPQVQPVFYDTANSHAAIEDLLKDLGDRWFERPRNNTTLAVAVSEAPLVSIFELMGPALRTNVDTTIAEGVGRHLVAAAKRLAMPHTDANSIVNRLAQRYGLPLVNARSLVAAYESEPPADKTTGTNADPCDVIAQGLYTRALAYDSRLQIQPRDVLPIAKAVLQNSLSAFGGNVALTMLHLDTPNPALFKIEIDKQLNQKWPKVGDLEREALKLAFADLFRAPSPEEDEVVSRLALTAVAFGLIQAFPEASLADHVLPNIVYIDANIALPLLTRLPNKDKLIRQLIQTLKLQNRSVVILRGFLNEVASHYQLALHKLDEYKLSTVRDVDKYLRDLAEPDEFINVFLLMTRHAGADGSESASKVLRKHFGDGRNETFAAQLELAGVKISDAEGDSERESALRFYILTNKKETYNRSLHARDILARNEARQLSVMEADVSAQRKPWFVTEDKQLRTLVRESGGLPSITLMSLAAAKSLVASVTDGSGMGTAFSRLLWSPDWHDRSDLVVAEAIRRVLPEVDASVRIPVEDARRFAAEELERRHKAEKDADWYTGAPPPPSENIVESVYRFLGMRIRKEDEKKS